MAKNYLTQLQKLDGAVMGDYNPHNHVIRTPSPSVNFTFGKGHGLPLGFSLCLFGPPKGGKSVLCNSTIGQLHRDDPEAFAIKFDTEFREEGQLTEADANIWGIDRDRYAAFSVNSPMLVFDRIEQEISALCQDGMPLKLVIIDSINGIHGRRAMNQESIETQQIGDHALTIQEGLKRILPIQRKHKFALILTAHVRAEMDALEVKRGNKVKMAAAFGLQHHCEYFLFIEPNRTADARKDLSGKEFVNPDLKDFDDKKSEITGHKIRVRMKDNSCGPKLRSGEFTLDYQRGIVAQYEEIFMMARNRGVLERPNNTTYTFKDKKWVGAPSMLSALKDDPALAKAVLDEIYRRDTEGAYAADDAAAEVAAD